MLIQNCSLYVYNVFISLNANRLEWEKVCPDPRGEYIVCIPLGYMPKRHTLV